MIEIVYSHTRVGERKEKNLPHHLPHFYIRRYFIFVFSFLFFCHFSSVDFDPRMRIEICERNAKKKHRKDGAKRQPTNGDKENHQIFIEFKWILIVYQGTLHAVMEVAKIRIRTRTIAYRGVRKEHKFVRMRFHLKWKSFAFAMKIQDNPCDLYATFVRHFYKMCHHIRHQNTPNHKRRRWNL